MRTRPRLPTAVDSFIRVSTFFSAWNTSTPARSPSGKVSAPIGTTMNSWASTLFEAWAPPRGCSSSAPAAPGRAGRRGSDRAATPSPAPPHGPPPMSTTRSIALAPRWLLFGVWSRSIISWSIVTWSSAAIPSSRGPMTSFTFSHRLQDALAQVTLAIAVAQLNRLVFAGGCAARHSRTAGRTAGQYDLGLHRRVSPAVDNLPPVHFNDRGHRCLGWSWGCEGTIVILSTGNGRRETGDGRTGERGNGRTGEGEKGDGRTGERGSAAGRRVRSSRASACPRGRDAGDCPDPRR